MKRKLTLAQAVEAAGILFELNTEVKGALAIASRAGLPCSTEEEQKAFLATRQNVALGSDAFFPFDDNIERAKKSGVSYIAEPGGSIRDDLVIEAADKYGMVMAFTGMRLFHH